MDGVATPLKFQPWSSSVDIGFWHELSRRKLDVYKLDESPLPLFGRYSTGSKRSIYPARFLLQGDAFEDNDPLPDFHFLAPGTLYNTNTVESFKSLDKVALLNSASKQIWDDIVSGEAANDPSLLNRFVLVTYADLKKYKYYYLFGFPALPFPAGTIEVEGTTPLKSWLTASEMESLAHGYGELRRSSRIPPSVFLCKKGAEEEVQVAHLRDWASFWTDDDGACAVGFVDPSNLPNNPGWPLRNLLLLLASTHRVARLRLLCYRGLPSASQPELGSNRPPMRAVGWERNERGKVSPRVLALGSAMDPTVLACSSVDLNLKLMKWRLMPSLDLQRIRDTKCLLIGAGTLGCNVARALLGWGVRHITFVDNGRVSFSNPVRQSLFTFEDCLEGGRNKAEAAASRLKQIFPGVTSVGHVLSVAMPGHSIPAAETGQAEAEYLQLCGLFAAHDVVFLGTDSRESRWLPTALGVMQGKTLINAALGFDTFVVMRHGVREGTPRLGCYFCNDVVAPQDSLTDRSLDQQCTVTRPGVAFLAASLAVELMVSVLQHPMGARAPADAGMDISMRPPQPLGIIPHQIRGFLSHYTNVIPVGAHYDRCTGCSDKIVDALEARGFEFVQEVCDNPLLLEALSGLDELRSDTADLSFDWDEEDDF